MHDTACGFDGGYRGVGHCNTLCSGRCHWAAVSDLPAAHCRCPPHRPSIDVSSGQLPASCLLPPASCLLPLGPSPPEVSDRQSHTHHACMPKEIEGVSSRDIHCRGTATLYVESVEARLRCPSVSNANSSMGDEDLTKERVVQASPSRFTQAMSSGYSRFTFILVATLACIHALDLAASPHQFDSAQTTIKFFTGGLAPALASPPRVDTASPAIAPLGACPPLSCRNI